MFLKNTLFVVFFWTEFCLKREVAHKSDLIYKIEMLSGKQLAKEL